MARFLKPTYKVRIYVGYCPNKLQPNGCILNTGAGRNIINNNFIQVVWKHKFRGHPTARLRITIKKLATLLETILFFVRIGELHEQVWFRIVENLSVDKLLGTFLIDRGI